MKFSRVAVILIVLLTALTFSLPADQMSAVDYFNEGRSAETEGDFFKAVEMYKSALQLNDKYFDAVSGLAHAYYGLDEYSESLKYVIIAETLDSENTDLLNLKARVFLNTGNLGEARDIFSRVLDIEENNIEAEFGLAELDIASGRILTAESRYEDVLLVSPESRKALLALVLINDNEGRQENAEYYLRQALKFYSDNAFVRYIAARHFFQNGNIDESMHHLKTALFLQPDFLDASILLCEIYMLENRYSEITVEIEKILHNHENEPVLWYLLGRAYTNLGNSEKSVMCYARALSIRPDEDLSRIALENEVISSFEMDSPLRETYSRYHIDLGQKNEARNMLDKALSEYRRALVINPYSVDARLLYGDIYKSKGYTERYLLILSRLVEEGLNSLDILDEIEIQKSMLDRTVSDKWNTDQFSTEKEKNSISIFFSEHGMSHAEGEFIISEYIEYLLMGYENIEIDSNEISDDFAYCFRMARESNSDYFIIFKSIENDRAVSIEADIYLASTGNKLNTVNVMRTGNQMIPEAGKALADEIHKVLPVYGRIVNRKFDHILVNLGSKDGLNAGDELLILKKGTLSRAKNDFSLEYSEDSVIGSYRVEQADELISDGVVEVKGFFDMINPGDLIFIKTETEDSEVEKTPEDAQMFYTGDLFNTITNIR